MPYKTVSIYNMRAVGMHHWGDPRLLVGGAYTLEWEPDCPYDPGNAMAIYDWDKTKRAYLTRQDAAIVSRLWVREFAIAEMMACIPHTEAHCVLFDLGPQHECEVRFRVKDEKLSELKRILDIHQCAYNVK